MFKLSDRSKKRLAYGFWRYREDEVAAATAMLALARESGIDHLDTADCYGGHGGFGGSERLLGALRQRAPSLFAGAVVATKVGIETGAPYNSSAAYLKAACDGSLSRLRMERIDLLYVHRPDLLTHPHALAETLDGLVASGKVGAIGVSNSTVDQIQALSRFLHFPVKVHQIEFSAAHVEPLFDGTLDQAMERDIAVAAWSPLAGGRLAEDGPAEFGRVREALKTIAAKHDASPAAVAIAFLQRHPAPVTPILGTTTPGRLRDAVNAAGIPLSRAEWYAIVEAARGEKMP